MIRHVDYVVVGRSLAGISAALRLADARARVVLIDFDRDTDAIADLPLVLTTPFGRPMSGAEFDDLAATLLKEAGVEYRSDCHITGISVAGETVLECSTSRWASSGLVFAPNGTEPGLTIKQSFDLQGFGVSYSAATDAPFFHSLRVAVYGDAPRVLEHAYVAKQFASHVAILIKTQVDDYNYVLFNRIMSEPTFQVIEHARIVALRSNSQSLSGIEFQAKDGFASLDVAALFVAQNLQPDESIIRHWRHANSIIAAGLAAGVQYWRHDALVADGERAAREILARV